MMWLDIVNIKIIIISSNGDEGGDKSFILSRLFRFLCLAQNWSFLKLYKGLLLCIVPLAVLSLSLTLLKFLKKFRSNSFVA